MRVGNVIGHHMTAIKIFSELFYFLDFAGIFFFEIYCMQVQMSDICNWRSQNGSRHKE
jgi:hypothetical protein